MMQRNDEIGVVIPQLFGDPRVVHAEVIQTNADGSVLVKVADEIAPRTVAAEHQIPADQLQYGRLGRRDVGKPINAFPMASGALANRLR